MQFDEQFSEVSTGNSIGFFHLRRGQVIEARACLIHRFHTCIDGRNSNILTLKGLKVQSKTKHFDFIDLSLHEKRIRDWVIYCESRPSVSGRILYSLPGMGACDCIFSWACE